MNQYGLYQTFNTSLPEGKRMTAKEKEKMVKRFSSATYEQKKAILCLIFEHARLEEESLDEFPYSLTQRGDDVEMKIDDLPVKLQWILWRFSTVINGS